MIKDFFLFLTFWIQILGLINIEYNLFITLF